VTSSWFFLSTLNYDARSTTHQICSEIVLTSDATSCTVVIYRCKEGQLCVCAC